LQHAGFYLRSFICVHLAANTSFFDFRAGPEEKHIRPQMNADERS